MEVMVSGKASMVCKPSRFQASHDEKKRCAIGSLFIKEEVGSCADKWRCGGRDGDRRCAFELDASRRSGGERKRNKKQFEGKESKGGEEQRCSKR